MTANSDFYDHFADWYCDYYRDVDTDEAVRQWQGILLGLGITSSIGPPKPRLLDLGCGPGLHLRPWQRAGYEVSGLDASRSMLVRAARIADTRSDPEITLYLANILESDAIRRICERFSRVVSHFNFCNLFSPLELDLLFANVFSLLEPGGSYIFDYSTLPGSFDIDDNPDVTTISSGTGPNYRVVRRWKLAETQHDETYWFHDLNLLRRQAEVNSLAMQSVDWHFNDHVRSTRKIVILTR